MPVPEQFIDKSITDPQILAQLEKDVGLETLLKLVNLFIDELGVMTTELSNAIEKNDVLKVKDIMHILKNSAALYGAIPLATLAGQLHDFPPIVEQENLNLAIIIKHNINKTRHAYQVMVQSIAI
ncbi:Hpt domain-containing protein [Pseudoalteromonas sp. TB64]|uniref:Hpt domain-containing protein n=1 Tax=Pseudoalteromonas sp. TB64 TaxID=1938600 RepID=UPI000417C14C|nr:Hpt domain-containing protein [Pseudoalteromonas sp. TB64]